MTQASQTIKFVYCVCLELTPLSVRAGVFVECVLCLSPLPSISLPNFLADIYLIATSCLYSRTATSSKVTPHPPFYTRPPSVERMHDSISVFHVIPLPLSLVGPR